MTICVNSSAISLTLHNTGEGLVQGQSDPNWTIVRPDNGVQQAISATDPNGAWIAPTAPNTWISTIGRGSVAVGVYKYSTTFSIAAGYDPSTAQITGNWWVDDLRSVNAIYLNGVKISDFDGAQYDNPSFADAAFSITSGFVSGVNTLSFWVENTGGPAGTLVQNLAGTVPDGGMTLALLGIALAGLQVLRRRLSR